MKKNFILGLCLFLVSSTCMGCRYLYSDEPLSGTVFDRPFTFVSGFVRADGHAGLFDEDLDFSRRPDAPETAPYLYFDLPVVAPARYRLQLRLLHPEDTFTVTGTAPGEPLRTYIRGNLEITEVTETMVAGRMHIFGDTDELNGIFVLERVPW